MPLLKNGWNNGTLMIIITLGIDTCRLSRKQNVREYWLVFRKMPDFHFEIKAETSSVNSIALYFKSVMEKVSIVVIFFNDLRYS